MSRSGYTDEGDDAGMLNLWRGNVDRAIWGKRGQAFLQEMAVALDAMPVKELVAGEIVRDSQHVCALGSVAVARGLDVHNVDDHDGEAVGQKFGIARHLAQEIAYLNDEQGPPTGDARGALATDAQLGARAPASRAGQERGSAPLRRMNSRPHSASYAR